MQTAGKSPLIEAATAEGWGAVAECMIRVDEMRLWAADHRSMTSWLREVAKAKGCKETSLWRFKSSGRAYNAMRQAEAQLGKQFPPLAQATSSPEVVELFAKLSRVAPEALINELRPRVLGGTATKRELTKMWSTLSPALDGKTARGRSVKAPVSKVDDAAIWKMERLIELEKQSQAWISTKPKYVRGIVTPMNSDAYACDSVLLSLTNADSIAEVHGIWLETPGDRGLTDEDIAWARDRVDCAWIVQLQNTAPTVPDWIGVLLIEDGKVKVMRPALTTTSTGPFKEQMLRKLMAHTMRWWLQ